MATVEQCREALRVLAGRMAADRANGNNRVPVDRPISCTVRDLGVSFHGRLADGKLDDLTEGEDPNAKIRVTTTSDDLVALVDGKLDLTRALASGRISVRANPFDLLKLRSMM